MATFGGSHPIFLPPLECVAAETSVIDKRRCSAKRRSEGSSHSQRRSCSLGHWWRLNAGNYYDYYYYSVSPLWMTNDDDVVVGCRTGGVIDVNDDGTTTKKV